MTDPSVRSVAPLTERCSAARWLTTRPSPRRYRTAIVAPDTPDALRNLGGLLFDMNAAGWEVTALVPEHADARPLRILGIAALGLEDVLAQRFDLKPNLVAVTSDSFLSDDRVRQLVRRCAETDRARVIVWGDTAPVAMGKQLHPATYRPSTAALAFKSYAQQASGSHAATAERTEAFWVEQRPYPASRPSAVDQIRAPTRTASARRAAAREAAQIRRTTQRSTT